MHFLVASHDSQGDGLLFLNAEFSLFKKQQSHCCCTMILLIPISAKLGNGFLAEVDRVVKLKVFTVF